MEMIYIFCTISIMIIAISFACLRQKFISIIPVSVIAFVISGILTSIIGAVVFNQEKDKQKVCVEENRYEINVINKKDTSEYIHINDCGWYSLSEFNSIKKIRNGKYKFSGLVIKTTTRSLDDNYRIFPWKMNYEEDQYRIKYLLLNDSVYNALVNNGK